MKTKPYHYLAAAFVLLPTVHLFAQTTGVSNPDALEDTVTAPATAGSHYAKPATAAPNPFATPALHDHADNGVVYGAYKPYVAPSGAVAGLPATAPTGTNDAAVVYSTYKPPISSTKAPAPFVPSDDNSGIVKSGPLGANELTMGTQLTAALQLPISTSVTKAGAHFTAVLQEDITRYGVVLLPIGTVIHGRITRVQGGRRMGIPPSIHLQTDTLSLPNGTVYKLAAEVTALNHEHASHVTPEGTIVGNSHAKSTAFAFALTTSSSTMVGAMIGGGPGALAGLGIGAGVSTIGWILRSRQEELPAGTEIVFSLEDKMHIDPVH
jgi:hypothetical protein